MIHIAGKPADLESVDGLNGNLERQIAGAMADSRESYDFDSKEELLFEIGLRASTVNAARLLDRSGMDFAVFRKSRCNDAFWRRTENGGFELKKGVAPSKAVSDIFENGSAYATECATAIIIVFYKAVLDMFVAKLFDKAFPEIYLMNWSRVDPLLRGVSLIDKPAANLPGDRMYFMNPDVDPAKPEWQGENVIVLDSDLYYGHGIGIRSGAQIIRDLNGHRVRNSDTPAYLIKQAGWPNYGRLYTIYKKGAV